MRDHLAVHNSCNQHSNSTLSQRSPQSGSHDRLFQRRSSFTTVKIVAVPLNFPNTEASLVMEVRSKEEQSEGNKSQAEWEETLINEVINDFLNSFDEVDVMLAQQAGIPTRACNVKNDFEPGARRYFLRSSKNKQK